MTDLSYVTAIFFRALLNAHIFKTIECILAGEVSTPPLPPPRPPPPDDIHHVCLRVLECVCVCVHNSFLSFVQKNHPRILKHFGFCILKCFISFSPLIFFIPFIQNWKSNFFFFLAIFSLDILCSVQLHNPPLLIWQQLENLVQRSTSTDC